MPRATAWPRVALASMLFIAATGPSLGGISVSDIVAMVNSTSYRSYLDTKLYTHTGDNRGYGAQHDLARTNIYDAFVANGLTTTLDPFLYGGNTYYNVVGLKQGTTRPNEYYIIGAHYDSVNNPGADDNASGTAGVLEAARVLSQYEFESSIVFIGFDREEQGLIGSKAWASAHAGWDIKGMVSLDMIAYNPAGPTQDTALLYGRAQSDPLKNALASALSTYGGISTTLLGQLDASDHAPFEWQGFEAALLIEGAVWSNPYYHQALDSVDTAGYIDYEYATNMTKGAVGWLAGSAKAVPESGTIVVLVSGSMMLGLFAWRRRACLHREP